MTELPNLDRLARRGADNLTAAQIQVLLIKRAAEDTSGGFTEQARRAVTLGTEVPALLAHIDELYGDNERLRLYADTTKYHQDQHAAAVRELEPLKERVAEARNLLDALDRTNDDVHAENLTDRIRTLLDGPR
jgi:hypothetical protein